VLALATELDERVGERETARAPSVPRTPAAKAGP
jgi:hypothetical protein